MYNRKNRKLLQSRLLFSIFLIISFSITFLYSKSAYPWGSLDDAPYVNTHKYIDEVAYEALKANTFFLKIFQI